MSCLKVAAVFVFIVVFAQGCELNAQLGQKIGMECAARHSDPAFLMAVAGHMQNPDSMAQSTFFCDYQKDVVNILMCLKDKLEECVPEQFKPLMDAFISKERMTEGLKFMCDHKEVLQDRCNEDHMQDFIQCYMGKVNQLQYSMRDMSNVNTNQMKGLVCRVIRSEEQCFRENKGSCSQKFIDTVIEILEKFFPMSVCDSSVKNDLENTLLGSLLIHGQPQGSLKFKPMNVPYVIKN